MISVAIATYNGEKYIIEKLETIMNQTKKVDEVIINDDCSLDDTVKIVKDYIDAKELINWNVYINDRNLGFSSNFFTAIKKPQ